MTFGPSGLFKYLFLFLPLGCFAQEVPSLAASFLSGAFDGTAETIKWHYYEFEEAFPKANPQFWNPKYSSQNKYKDGITGNGPKYFGSTTFLAWTTDGYHMMRTGRNAMIITTLALHPKKKKTWKGYALDILFHTLAYQAGFHVTYGMIFKSRLY